MQQYVVRNGEKVHDRALKIIFKDGQLDLPTSCAGDVKLFKRKEQVGPHEEVRLDSMRGRKTWEKRKAKAAANVLNVAKDLLEMYAVRLDLERPPCLPDDERMDKFRKSFTYEPTPDQNSAFEDIKQDMTNSTRPMDRLICGDVGFGKTEVAMSAIYRTVCNGKQVALLAPTTVLAAQHLRVLRKRMPDVRIEMLSSLIKRNKVDREAVMGAIESGEVEVVVGTHALLSRSVKFGDVGLLVVDEEQRFGVRQKEKVKEASKSVDVLSLSATPIPRTMYMCMTGIREMSKLRTPPPGRKAVVTQVMERQDSVMQETVQLELDRNGQVFYVVPRVEMVRTEVDVLQTIFPDARITYAYGGLKDLEERIVDFTLGNVDIMVATTILENGIDIPNVNTIVIQNTHLFGLAQLHQLRGRVGRSEVQAYALLMHPKEMLLTGEARRRLNIVQKESGLGAGFALAEGDLNLRGAGNVFGEEQKGMAGLREMGLDMYMDILQKAMKYLNKKKELGLDDTIDDEQLLLEAITDDMLLGLDDSLSISRYEHM